MSTSTIANFTVEGVGPSGSTSAENPVLMAGISGTGKRRTILTDDTGAIQTAGGGVADVATSSVAIAAAGAASALKAAAGRLISVLVTTQGTAAVTFFDNPTTAAGTVIGIIPAGEPAGSRLIMNAPAANGIWATNGAGCPAYTGFIV